MNRELKNMVNGKKNAIYFTEDDIWNFNGSEEAAVKELSYAIAEEDSDRGEDDTVDIRFVPAEGKKYILKRKTVYADNGQKYTVYPNDWNKLEALVYDSQGNFVKVLPVVLDGDILSERDEKVPCYRDTWSDPSLEEPYGEPLGEELDHYNLKSDITFEITDIYMPDLE